MKSIHKNQSWQPVFRYDASNERLFDKLAKLIWKFAPVTGDLLTEENDGEFLDIRRLGKAHPEFCNSQLQHTNRDSQYQQFTSQRDLQRKGRGWNLELCSSGLECDFGFLWA
ncbi:hypothetical protein L1987_15989 [Smallanthus sonchifolius]|uniref:Uncharacterized protein n=1 Tax=Smallanthus sonchifolius TaxID=185202 RepID=A0ACB9J980_9ASTR|nr:hypothetical protein L1987_15989 [Smallanthus sonchifolius]